LFEQRVGERKLYTVDFSRQVEVARGETIQFVNSVVSRPEGLVFSRVVHDKHGMAQAWVEVAGPPGNYHAVFTVTTGEGSRLVAGVPLRIVPD